MIGGNHEPRAQAGYRLVLLGGRGGRHRAGVLRLAAATVSDADFRKLLDEHPGFRAKLAQFMALYDAADVLDDLKPPHSDTAAAYLREIGRHIMLEAGIPENFLEAMIAGRPALV